MNTRSKCGAGGRSGCFCCWPTDPYLQEVHVGCYAQQYCHYSIVIYHSPELGLQFTSSIPVGLGGVVQGREGGVVQGREGGVVQGKEEGDREDEKRRGGGSNKQGGGLNVQ